MRILVISDVHANITALEAVIADAGKVDETWCLGDVVGYGPDPNECVERIASLPNLTCVMGNHDAAALGQMPVAAFNGDARRALEWQMERITPKSMDFLRSLPVEPQVRWGVTLVHGSPRDPIWEYIINTLNARMNFPAFETQLCFVGHSHLQMGFEYVPTNDRIQLTVTQPGDLLALERRSILNPGSVGQPRDRNPKAAYAIFTPETMGWRAMRVEYAIESVQERIRTGGLPEKQAARLAEGW